MADPQFTHRRSSSTAVSILQNLIEHSPNSEQLVGLAALVVSGAILLILTGLTLTAAILGLIFFTPLILISSPIWIPIGGIIFLIIAGALSVIGVGAASTAVVSWVYRYIRGMNPPGSSGVDYARIRISDTAGQVKEYARDYGVYLQSKVKDAAPSA